MPITSKERTYLKNKHKGGKNNSKGAYYESFYATYQIALFMHQYTMQMENVYFSTQLKDTFVDDLLIEEPATHKIYHQLKDVVNLTWQTGKLHSLEYDFRKQIEISTKKGEDFQLKLVYSNATSSVAAIPTQIALSTTSEHFPACASINQLILSYPPFREAIQLIMAQPQSGNDELSGVASAILGAWNSIEQKNVSLRQISDITHAIGKGYVNMKTYPTVTISDECKKILNRLGILFYANGSTVYWSYGNLKGEVIWTDKTEHSLQVANPTDIWSLMEVLS